MLNKCRTARHVLFQERMLLKYRDNNINHVSCDQVREYIFGKDCIKKIQTYQKAFSSGIKSSNKPAKKFMACMEINPRS
jgi:hypothetical protein